MTDNKNPIEINEKRAFWKNHFENWKSSGQTQAAYCRQNNLKSRALTYWKKKFQNKKPESQLVPVNLQAPIQVMREKETSPALKLSVKNRFEVEIGDNFSPVVLEKLLRVLENF